MFKNCWHYPESVDVYIDENELIIQNYGNSMNNYVIFDDIGEKYIANAWRIWCQIPVVAVSQLAVLGSIAGLDVN